MVVIFDKLERCSSVVRREDSMSSFREHFLDCLTNRGLVFDQQNSSTSPGKRFYNIGNGIQGKTLGCWQVNREGGSVIRPTEYFDRTPVLLYDAVNGGEPQARALPEVLCSEKRLENVGLGLGVHTRTIISDC